MVHSILLEHTPFNSNMGNLNINNGAYLGEVTDAGPTRNGLVLHLDAGDVRSYFGGGTWYDLSGRGNHISVLPAAFNVAGKYMDFNGSFGCAKYEVTDFIPSTTTATVTAVVWTRIARYDVTGTCRTLFRGKSSSGNHWIIGDCSGWTIGMYNNDNAIAYQNSGYSQQSLPGYNAGRWNMMVWRFQTSSPYYLLTINDTPSVTSGQLTDARDGWPANKGICSIGAYNNDIQAGVTNASQYWGDIASVRFYNRVLTNAELLNIWNVTKGRFAL